MDIVECEVCDFGGAEAAGVHGFEYGAVAEPHGECAWVCAGCWCIEECAHGCWREDIGECLPDGWAVDELGGVFGNSSVCGEESEEHAYGGEVSRDG